MCAPETLSLLSKTRISLLNVHPPKDDLIMVAESYWVSSFRKLTLELHTTFAVSRPVNKQNPLEKRFAISCHEDVKKE